MGLYDGDTRILSCSVLRIAGERPVILHSDPGGSWRGVVHGNQPEFRKDPGDKMGGDERILRQTISVGRERTIAEAYRERLEVQNHGPIAVRLRRRDRVRCRLRRHLRGPRLRPGRPRPAPADRADRRRRARLRLRRARRRHRPHACRVRSRAGRPARRATTRPARWWPAGAASSAPGEQRLIAWTVHATREPAQTVHALDPEALDPARAHEAWLSRNATIETDHELINQVVQRSLDDLCLLESTDPAGDRFIAAGVPWFTTLFGRDALITVAPGDRVRAAARGADPRDPGQAPGDGGGCLARRRAGQDPPRAADRRDEPDRRAAVRAVLRLDRRDAAVADPARRDARLDGRRRAGRPALAERPGRPRLDRPLGRPRRRRVRRVRATGGHRPPQPGLEGLVRLRSAGSDGSTGRDADRPGRGAGLRLRRQAADRPAGPASRRRGAGEPARARGVRPAATGSPSGSGWPDGSIAMALDRREAAGGRVGSNAGHALWTGIVLAEHAGAVAPPSGRPTWCPAGACGPTRRTSRATTRSATTPGPSGRTTRRSRPPACAATASTTPPTRSRAACSRPRSTSRPSGCRSCSAASTGPRPAPRSPIRSPARRRPGRPVRR